MMEKEKEYRNWEKEKEDDVGGEGESLIGT